MCVKVPWRMTCGCDEEYRAKIIKCPVALSKNLGHCQGLETSSPILGDVPCTKCAALVGASHIPPLQEGEAVRDEHPEKAKQHHGSEFNKLFGADEQGQATELPTETANLPSAESDSESVCTLKTKVYDPATDEAANAMEKMTITGNLEPKHQERYPSIDTIIHALPLPSPVRDEAPTTDTADYKSGGLSFDAPPEQVKDPAEEEILLEAVEKIVEFVEENRGVEITHHDKPAGHRLEHGESVTLKGVVDLDEDTSVEVKVKVVKE